MDGNEFRERLKERDKRFKRDVYFGIINLIWAIPLLVYAIAKIIEG